MQTFNGIPALGLGTWGRSGDEGFKALLAALEIGYRHIDTAQTYKTEANVGEAIRRSGIPRSEMFITTKVARVKLAPRDFLPSLKQSLDLMRLDVIDLVLIHWPSADPSLRLEDYVEKLGEAKRLGIARLIGVSNFPNALLDRAVSVLGKGEIATNQVEMHPFLQNRKVLDRCRAHGVAVTAYMPLAQGRVAGDPVLQKIGTAHAATANQVALAWLNQLGAIAIPASGRREHLKSNFDARHLRLSEADMDAIASLERGERIIDPADAPDWD
jgi:2,5-diketo-D-gluconate reductase B